MRVTTTQMLSSLRNNITATESSNSCRKLCKFLDLCSMWCHFLEVYFMEPSHIQIFEVVR